MSQMIELCITPSFPNVRIGEKVMKLHFAYDFPAEAVRREQPVYHAVMQSKFAFDASFRGEREKQTEKKSTLHE
jgi:hypothetical protein